MVVYFDCTNLTSTEFGQLSLARGITAIILLFVVYHTFLYISFTYKTSLASLQQRVFFYLTISTLFYLAVLSGQIEHYFNFKSPNDAACKAIGFLDQYSGSVQLVYILEIVLVLFYTIGKACCSDKILNCKHCLEALIFSIPCCPDKKFKYKHLLEASMIFSIPWILPLPFAFMPFASTLVPYGETGPWCWIQSRNKNCSAAEGSLEELLLWYIPFGVAACFGALCVLVSLIFLYLRKKSQPKKLSKFIGEFQLLLFFLVGYVCLFAIEVGCRLKAFQRDEYSIWMVHAISTPLSAIVIPIAFMVYLRYKPKHKQEEDEKGMKDDQEADEEMRELVTSGAVTNCDQCFTRSGETIASIVETERLLKHNHATYTA